MSGIYISGMEMPKSCAGCIFDTWGLCLINTNLEGKDEHTHSCHLVPVPPHGRLIDADALMDSLLVDYPSVVTAIDTAPTIIPADKGVDECLN